MATLSNILTASNPLSQMKKMGNTAQSSKLGDAINAPDVVFNPTQRLDNQLKTSSQVQNYASSKNMAEQGRSDMRGNVIGYSETLG